MILVAGVGYSDLGDLSFGPLLIERARGSDWPPGVHFEDLSYNPIAAVEWLREQGGRFSSAIMVGAVQRGRPPGSLSRVRWTDGPGPPDAVQGRIAEAVTGTISLENLLAIAAWFGVLPPLVEVVELEPRSAEPMSGPSAFAAKRMEELLARLRAEASASSARGDGHPRAGVVAG